jgi:type I restriction enzyme S subunit
MSEWKEVKLGEVATFRNGLNFKNESHGFGCKIIGVPDFGDRLIPDYDSIGEINPEGILKDEDYLKLGDIIFVRSNGNKNLVGRSLYINNVEKPMVFSGFCIRTRIINENILSLFLAYFFKTSLFRKMISASAGGTNIQNLNQGLLFNSLIPFPPLPTQQRIASILSAYDDLIENNLKRIKLLEEIAQRTYEEWFVKFRINGVPLEVGENGLPEGWERKRLNEVVDIVSGYAFKSKEYIEDGSFKIVTIKNVQDGYFIPQTTDTIETMPNNLKESQILKTGDFILSLTGNVGRTCMVYGDNFLLNQRVAKIVVKKTINNAFIYCLLRSRTTITNLENMSNGAAQQNLSPVNMGNMTIVFGNEKILLEYSQKFNASLNLICKLNLQNSLLKESRDILLPRLMSGKLGV